uniref:Putative secreted protein n=1 Tax=Amblyomma cajennense TaxID=34607 RepID=A0A023FD08_AMBCJ
MFQNSTQTEQFIGLLFLCVCVVAVHVYHSEPYCRLCLLTERPKIWYNVQSSHANEMFCPCRCTKQEISTMPD